MWNFYLNVRLFIRSHRWTRFFFFLEGHNYSNRFIQESEHMREKFHLITTLEWARS